MAGDVAKGLFSLPFILWAFAACCSGPLVDANRGSRPTPSATEAVAFLKGNRAPSTENRVSFPFPHQKAQLDSLSSTGGVNRPGEEEEIFLSPRRELSSHGSHQPSSATKATRHDIITNPVTTGPVTLPSTNPTPGIITVPSTNPVTVLPTTGPAVTVPSTTPLVYPMPAPATNPVTTPPITIPSTIPAPPGTVPITNPVTTYPFPPPSDVPFVPGTPPVPVSPAVAGQAWCVARSDAADAALQMALDYACGIGGADCSAIQQTGGCYNPNTVRDHASYAFNSYYQKNPSPTSCDFGGTATVVNTNPSTATCIYPSTSSGAPVFNTYNPNTYNPTVSNPTGPTTVFGSSNPLGQVNPSSTTTPSNSLSLAASLPLLISLMVASLNLTRWPL